MLEAFSRDLKAGTRPALLRASRRAYGVGLGLAAVPSLMVAAVQVAYNRAPLALGESAGVLLLAAVLSGGAYVLARRSAHRPGVAPSQTALTGAFQAASAPGVPLLLAGAFVPGWALVGLLLVLATGAHALAWSRLDRWVREPEAREVPPPA